MESERSYRARIDEALAMMAANYAKIAPATDPIDKHSRALTPALTQAVMQRYADTLDKGEDLEAFAQGATHALGNVLATLASFCSDGAPGSTEETGKALCAATNMRAMLTILEPQHFTVIVPLAPS